MNGINLKPKNNFSQQLKWANSLNNNSNYTTNNNKSQVKSVDNSSIFTPFVENNNR